MTSIRQYKYYWGVLLQELMDKIGVDQSDRGDVSKLLHWMFKRYFNVETTSDLPPSVMEEYLSHIRIVCNVEFGIFLHEPNEDNMEDMEMGEFLHYKMN